MSGTRIGNSFEDAFRHAENSKAAEAAGQWDRAAAEMRSAVHIFSQLEGIEAHPGKKDLLRHNINTFTCKIDLFDKVKCGDRLFDEVLKKDEAVPRVVEALIPAYISVADVYLEAVKLGGNAVIKKRLGLVLDRVEELKRLQCPVFPTPPAAPALTAPPAADPTPKREVPLVPGKFSQNEMDVLKKSSCINGKLFFPWLDGEEDRERFRYPHVYSDPDGLLALSADQVSAKALYRRPREIAATPGADSGTVDCSGAAQGGTRPIVMIRKVDPLSVTQDLVSDCSFVCSLCIAAEYEKKFKKQLITKIIYPQDSNGFPQYNAYGKYLVKLFLNGIHRKVVVDDLLPVDANGKLLCSRGECGPSGMELWVSIIEKAYMKVNGGYDFPGSNSGIDLYALTGWIPERVYFESNNGDGQSREGFTLDHRQSEDRAWNRIKSAMSFGDCLVTIATAPSVSDREATVDDSGRLAGLSVADQDETGLVPSHAYAVLDVQELCGLRLLKVKNPWSRRAWKGRFSSQDAVNWTPSLRSALGVSESEFRSMSSKGIFWIELSDCRKFFKSFFLNWNPSLFSFRYTLHAVWPFSQGPRIDSYFVGDNPQYTLSILDPLATAASLFSKAPNQTTAFTSEKKSVWILLSRHVVSKNQETDPNDENYVTIHVYRSGRRIFGSPAAPFVKGLYSSDPHCLCRFDIESDRVTEWHHFTLVLSQVDKKRDIAYSLSVFSTTAFRLTEAPSLHPYQLTATGRWSSANGSNGGTPSSVFFYRNPQYRLILRDSEKMANLHLHAKYPKEISASISVVDDSEHGAGRIDSIHVDKELLTSGDYRPGFCFVEGQLQEGKSYVVVVSAFSTTMEGPLQLTVAAENPVEIVELLPEGSGLHASIYTGSWSKSKGTCAGCSNFGRYTDNPTYVFQLKSDTTLTARLVMVRAVSGSDKPMVVPPSAAMNISLFSINSHAFNAAISPTCLPTYRCLNANFSPKTSTTSSNGGVYSDKNCGVSIPQCELAAGYWAIVVSTFDPAESEFSFSIHSSVPVELYCCRG